MFEATLRAAEVLKELLEADEADTVMVDGYRDELAALVPLLGLERFDRRVCNKALAACAMFTPYSKESTV
ncbi:MAG: hypothetical protein ACRDQA_03290 [Nocardioidaceae bacterium]